MLLQLAALIAFAALQFHRYALSYDEAAYAQAWWLIAHGHLDPFSSVVGIRFLANDGELLIWMLAPLAWVAPTGLTLLVVQDCALVATNGVAIAWVLEVLSVSDDAGHRRVTRERRRSLLGWLAIGTVVLDPWCYVTAAFPFHLEAFVALFATLATRALWRRRPGLVPLWAVLLLATGFIGGLALAGLGLGELAAQRGRGWRGWLLFALGLGWVLTLLELHLAGAGGLVTRGDLAYLLPAGQHPGLARIALAALSHPGKVFATVAPRLPLVLLLLLPLGVVGILTPRAAGLMLTTWGVPLLLTGPLARLIEAFQFWPAMPVVLVGTVIVVASGRPRAERVPVVVLTASCAAAAAILLRASAALLPTAWLTVSPAQASVLATTRAETPPGAEVVTVNPIPGRFAHREQLFVLATPERFIPVAARPVIFILAPQLMPLDVDPSEVEQFETAIARLPGVRRLPGGSGIMNLRWDPPRGVRGIEFPSGALVPG